MFAKVFTYSGPYFLPCFRQPEAKHSHCSLIHGYSLGFKFTFESEKLDDKNWVYDFGNCKWIKKYLEEKFDHTLAIDKADPSFDDLYNLKTIGLANVVVMDGVGCEKFAEHVYKFVAPEVAKQTKKRVRLKSVEVFEHGANSAIYSA